MTLRRTASGLTALRAAPRRLLAVFAHPDDESYGCAGVLARLARDPDCATALLCLTRGEASSMGREHGLTADAVAALREARLVEVAGLCGLDGLLVGDLPDGRLAELPLDRLVAPLEAALVAFAPQVVIAHDARGVNGHPDHIASHWAVRTALRAREGTRLALVAYTAATCEAARPRLMFATRAEAIHATIPLDAREVDVKEACLRAHEAPVTLRDDGPAGFLRRPAVEHFAFFGEPPAAPLEDLFAGLAPPDEVPVG